MKNARNLFLDISGWQRWGVLLVFLTLFQLTAWAQPSFILSQEAPNQGDNFCMDMTVDDFTNILSFEFSISFDPSTLDFDQVTNFNLTGLSGASFDLSQADNGIITVSWEGEACSPTSTGITLPDGTVIFSLCFDAIGGYGTTASVDITNDPVPIRVTRNNSCPANIGLIPIPGFVSTEVRPISLIATQASGNPDDLVCITVSATGFDDMVSMQLSINFDPAVLEFENALDLGNLPNLSVNNFGVPPALDGVVTLSWSAEPNMPVTLPDSTEIFQLCFRIVGDCETSTDVSFTSNPTPIEFTNDNDQVIGFNIPFFPVDGGVQVGDCAPTGLELFADCGMPVEISDPNPVCVQVTVGDNFTNLTDIAFLMSWNPSILEFQNIANINAGVMGLDAGDFNTANAANGVLGLDWETLATPQNLAPGSVLFEVCFDVVGLGGNSPFAFSADQAVVLQNNATNIGISPNNCEVQIIQPEGVTLIIPDQAAPQGDTVCLDFQVNNFEEVESMQFSLSWDPVHLNFIEVANLALPDGSLANFNTGPAPSGSATFSWNPASAVTLPDGSVVFSLCFEVVGPLQACDFLQVVDFPIVAEVTTTESNGDNVGLTQQGGEVCVLDPEGFRLVIGKEEGLLGDTVCVPFELVGFTDILDADFDIVWDPTGLELVDIVPAGPLGLDPGLNFDQSAINVGLLGFNWDSGGNPQSLADSTLLFELCFQLVGEPRECEPVAIGSSPTPIVTTALGPGSLIVEEDGEVCILDQFVVEDVIITPESCRGARDGSIEIVVSGGDGGPFITWNTSPQQFGPVANNLSAGEIDVTIFDAANPPLNLQNTFSIPEAPGIPQLEIGDNVVFPCDMSTLGLDPQSVSQGPNYSYKWTSVNGAFSGPTTNRIVAVTQPGEYYLSVTNDTLLCTVRDTIRVLPPETPTADAGMDVNFDCQTEQITLGGGNTTQGDTVSYQWTKVSGDGNLVPGTENFDLADVDGPGLFALEVTFDATGCSQTDTVRVIDNRVPVFADAGDNIPTGCDGSIVLLDASASGNTVPVNYEWYDLAGNLLSTGVTTTVTAVGTIVLIVTDPVSTCTATDTVEVIPNEDFIPVTLPDTSSITCVDEQIALEPVINTNQNYDFQWTAADGGQFLPGTENQLDPVAIAAGTYLLEVTNTTTNCVTRDSVIVDLDTLPPDVQIAMPQELTCTNQTVVLDASGTQGTPPFTFTWTTADGNILEDLMDGTVEVDSAGTYTVDVVGANGCEASASVEVIQGQAPPELSPQSFESLDCITQQTTLITTVSPNNPNYQISWTKDGFPLPSADGLILSNVGEGGLYEVTVEDPLTGCVVSATFEVEQDVTLPEVDLGGVQTLNCNRSTALLGQPDTSGSLTFQWNVIVPGETPADPTASQIEVGTAGTYELVVTDTTNGCTNSATVEVRADFAEPTIILAETAFLDCQNDTVLLDASASAPAGLLEGNWTGLQGQNVFPTANPLIAEVVQVGDYQLVLTNSGNGCSSDTTIVVEGDTDLPIADAGFDQQVPCVPDAGQQLNGSASSQGPEFIYLWTSAGGGAIQNETSLTPTVFGPGLYTLSVTNQANGCSSTDEVQVALDGSLPQAEAGEDMTLCEDGTMLAGNAVNGGSTGLWTTPGGAAIDMPDQAATFASGLAEGSNVFVWSLSTPACTNYSQDSVSIVLEPVPGAQNDIFNLPIGTLQAELDVTANDDLFSEDWTLSISQSPALGQIDTLAGGLIAYQIEEGVFGEDVFSYLVCSANCPDKCDSAQVQVFIPVDPDYEGPQVPNAITPNGDGLNDMLIFEQLENPERFPDNEIVIFNRWGSQVYTASPYMNDWQGTTDNGNELPQGTYYYILRLSVAEGEVIKGDITILK